ncbi:hypothetical protein BCR44DRAFT_1438244 [Catenaria anguillulae PL171]|uniref:Uncharacterized protein n=1 Tax=Catenaria anguillulae PL171 TaxID=765915 RepID=A0A1Y2HG96_9FUNG|nr:hypothetical protein BCR44DRAFT_1438244 [Catenaria anguillulae PL171]
MGRATTMIWVKLRKTMRNSTSVYLKSFATATRPFATDREPRAARLHATPSKTRPTCPWPLATNSAATDSPTRKMKTTARKAMRILSLMTTWLQAASMFPSSNHVGM